jgi:iron-sulfur cluster assembly accessory protein
MQAQPTILNVEEGLTPIIIDQLASVAARIVVRRAGLESIEGTGGPGPVPITHATGLRLCYNLDTLGSKEIRMATTSVPDVKTNVPQANPEVKKTPPVSLTASAVSKVKEIMGQQTPVPAGLRIGVVGGGCSGFSYSMQFENAAGMMDKTFDMDGLKVFVDATSVMYLNGCIVDYVETLEGAGFKFENPNVKSTCGCGSSFSV